VYGKVDSRVITIGVLRTGEAEVGFKRTPDLITGLKVKAKVFEIT
jgi:hypothetical protein